MTPEWLSADPPGPHSAVCVHCRRLTFAPVEVRYIESMSGPGIVLYACPEHAPHVGVPDPHPDDEIRAD
ncbi:hypothetical protein H8N00_02560 [Streptomyces sp. AC563]|uniref:hypothetical protein n=1 Tax=Streptomyces buecherae TaxID=2763006 RepID=UPI00164D5C8E|nr:hypothetical protein [Streptomyces buecherae]MBC3987806.1 hypothetical protein [Streptomyces buecherae]